MLTCHNLCLGYHKQGVLNHLNGNVAKGDLLALIGPNGAGKSTLLKTIMGLLPPISGESRFNLDRRNIAYLPQQSDLELGFPISVYELVAMGLWSKIGPFRRLTAAFRRQVLAAMEQLGIVHLKDKPIGSLSGGQKQRMLFARLMLQDSEFILLDEPFNNIDTTTTQLLLQLMQGWQQQGKTQIAVVHDLHLVQQYFSKTWLLSSSVCHLGNTQEVLNGPELQQAYLGLTTLKQAG